MSSDAVRKIAGLKDMNYWDRLKKLKLMSLQRRRKRYYIIQVWKIINRHAPNDVQMQFKTHFRLGIKALIPRINTKAQISVRCDYDSSFGVTVRAAQLWNIVPSYVSQLNPLKSFKIGLGRFVEQFPDTPPVPGTQLWTSTHCWAGMRRERRRCPEHAQSNLPKRTKNTYVKRVLQILVWGSGGHLVLNMYTYLI